ncbi:MAG TPA: phosphoenolpyruvate carboxykinase (GTP), partial [Polyangiaceae bacterium]|nr:phosphoenolpyruvate carboxykinase (GTP) [Polyangiaceae bacterium]
MSDTLAMSPSRSVSLEQWVRSIAEIATPERIVFCDGSKQEIRALEAEMVGAGTLIPLSAASHPRSFLHRSHPSDVARSEQLTFVCPEEKDDAGPTNNWMSADEFRSKVLPLFSGCMAKRTMFVVPYLMGPAGSRYARVGVEITDSPYVVANLRIMTRLGDAALQLLRSEPDKDFVKGVHSLGDLSPERRFVCHFPETRSIWSIGSGYGGNALLAKKCHALRIASAEARDEGWLAEHMLVVGVKDPKGRVTYFAAAFPSGCGKTNLAMLIPNLPGYEIETIGDDIAWMHVGDDGRLWATNPEAGMFGIAPGTSPRTNPNAMRAIESDTIFTNVALTPDGRPWWEGLDERPPEGTVDWQGRVLGATHGGPAAHPNARYTVAIDRCPSVGKGARDPKGVPISGIIFGGRRSRLTPLVYEATSFRHGVYVGATMVSETTAAATGATGVPRHDPMAMLPFCGYNMGDYFGHWLEVGKRLSRPPRVFHVNWFRQDTAGRTLWPGFGENIRVLEWMIRRVHDEVDARSTVLGYVPTMGGIDLSGLSLSPRGLELLLEVDAEEWSNSTDDLARFLARFGGRLPRALLEEHDAFVRRVASERTTSSA